jgi:hypothetical protein
MLRFQQTISPLLRTIVPDQCGDPRLGVKGSLGYEYLSSEGRFGSIVAMVDARKPLPAGLSFDLRDLFLAQMWAACRAFRMVIELDFRADDGDEYEELLVFYRPSSAFRWCVAWRSDSEIVVQRSNGQTQRFATLTEALEDLSPAGHPQQPNAIRTRGSYPTSRAEPIGSHTRSRRSHEQQHGHQ